jgi:hypothetical protein
MHHMYYLHLQIFYVLYIVECGLRAGALPGLGSVAEPVGPNPPMRNSGFCIDGWIE